MSGRGKGGKGMGKGGAASRRVEESEEESEEEVNEYEMDTTTPILSVTEIDFFNYTDDGLWEITWDTPTEEDPNDYQNAFILDSHIDRLPTIFPNLRVITTSQHDSGEIKRTDYLNLLADILKTSNVFHHLTTIDYPDLQEKTVSNDGLEVVEPVNWDYIIWDAIEKNKKLWTLPFLFLHAAILPKSAAAMKKRHDEIIQPVTTTTTVPTTAATPYNPVTTTAAVTTTTTTSKVQQKVTVMLTGNFVYLKLVGSSVAPDSFGSKAGNVTNMMESLLAKYPKVEDLTVDSKGSNETFRNTVIEQLLMNPKITTLHVFTCAGLQINKAQVDVAKWMPILKTALKHNQMLSEISFFAPFMKGVGNVFNKNYNGLIGIYNELQQRKGGTARHDPVKAPPPVPQVRQPVREVTFTFDMQNTLYINEVPSSTMSAPDASVVTFSNSKGNHAMMMRYLEVFLREHSNENLHEVHCVNFYIEWKDVVKWQGIIGDALVRNLNLYVLPFLPFGTIHSFLRGREHDQTVKSLRLS